MKRIQDFLLFCVVFFVGGSCAFSQSSQPVLISGDFRGVGIEEFVKQVEAKTNYHFYYDPLQFDLLVINTEAKNQRLEDVLQEMFKNSDYNFAIDGKRVFLLKQKTINTSLPLTMISQVKDSAYWKQTALANSKEEERKGDVARSALGNKLFEIGLKTNEIKEGTATLSGTVVDGATGQPLPDISIYVEGQSLNISTDENGKYQTTLRRGRYVIKAKGIGKREARYQLVLYSDGLFNIALTDDIPMLKEVVVSAERVANVNRVQMGVEKLSIKSIKQVPVVFGEADVLRAILTLPGVKSVGEASTGFNVRGGAADQNLILFNDATIYNPSHFFGFFSAFNPEIIKEVELYKSSIPAQYGGRLASVLDVTGREGNKEKFTGSAGIGLLTSRVNIEGPIKKNRSSFLFGGRTTYSDWLIGKLPNNSGYQNSKAAFYDLNLLVNQQLNDKNSLSFTGYFSKDRFNLNSDTFFTYQNRNVSVKWKHSFSSRLTSFLTVGNDYYEYANQSDHNPVNAYKMSFNIRQSSLKLDFNYNLREKHKLDFGASSIYYELKPGSFQPWGDESLVTPVIIKTEQALESAVYLSHRYDISKKLSFNPGIRYSVYNYLGPQSVNEYAQNLPKTETNLINTAIYGKRDIIKTYGGPEIRVGMRYNLSSSFSIKAAYNTSRQYLHMLSNTTAISPTDIWKLSDPNIKPQYGEQVSLGFYKNLNADSIELSFEVYKKRIQHYLDYKSGAILVLNEHIETDVFNTKGRAYGAEVMVKKRVGKLNGWASYTYSRILIKMDDPYAGEMINEGNYYPANYDKPHDFTFIGNYRVNQRFSVSLNLTYSTGRPVTVPIGRFYYAGSERTVYSDRNSYRIPDYFRSDFSMNIEGNHKVHQRTHNSWTIGLYNLTGRKNPYSIYFISEGGVIKGYKLSIFGSIIPFVNYNIRF